MPTNYLFPTAAELDFIAQTKVPQLAADRKIFDIMPMTNVDEFIILWEQLDRFQGLQQVRGLNGEPPIVKTVGLRRYQMMPGVYGEFMPVFESDILLRRVPGTFGQSVDVNDLVMIRQDQLLQRRLDRIESIGWTLLNSGTFSVPGPTGAVIHTDTYTPQQFSAGVPWATFATSTPLADFSAVQLLNRGYSVDFGAAATAYMNRATFNNLRSNTNNADLYGRRTAGLGTFNNIAGINQLLLGDDLPQIDVYDNTYLDDAGNVQLFIPNNKVIVVGKRPAGQTVAQYRMVRNVNTTIGPGVGPYMRVIDKGESHIPRTLEVHDGHNGGPVMYYPSAIVVMSV